MKRDNSRPSGSIDFIFSMLLFLVFILCSVFTILIGSRVYSNIRARNDAAFYSDTALSYITNKVRQSDRTDSVDVRTIDGQNVLVLSSDYYGVLYETWIYTKDGSLMELFSEQGSGLSAGDGLPVTECPPVSFSIENEAAGEMLVITLEGEPSSSTAKLFLRSASNPEGGSMQ